MKTLTYAEAAARVGLSVRTLESHVAAGSIPHRRRGRRVLFDPDALDQWANGDEQPVEAAS